MEIVEILLMPSDTHGLEFPTAALPSSTGLAPAVCRAGYLQFSGDRSFTNSHVQSRAFFWCKSGTGRFVVNGEAFILKPRDLYILPWDRTISYEPDAKNPMFTGHVHLIPDYRPGSDWIPNVPHRRNDVAYNSPDRRDVDWPHLRGVPRFKIFGNDRIALLLDYTIRWFRRGRGSNEAEARHLGHLLVGELMLLQSSEEQEGQGFPEELRRMVAHIDANYMRSPTVAELADIIKRSRSHVLKLFKTQMGISAKRYIIRKQLGEACEQLLSTTKSIAEIGHAVGLSDPYHFSKLFKRHINLSPTEYRRNHGPVDFSGDQA